MTDSREGISSPAFRYTDGKKESAMKRWMTRFLKNMILLIITGMTMMYLSHCVLLIAFVPSCSMEDTIKKGDIVIGLRHVRKYNRGAIVIFRYDAKSLYIKRIIGIPGDTVEVSKQGLIVNGAMIREKYLKEKAEYKEETVFMVPEGQVLLLGDNRNHSNDARSWKEPYRDKEDILARACFGITLIPLKIRRL